MNELIDVPIIDPDLENSYDVNNVLDKIHILKQRAIALSIEHEPSEIKDKLLIVEFMIQGEKFAFDIQYIKQVSHLNNLTPLPCTPDFIAGIINYHGRIVTVINLSTFFELPDENLAENQIIILENSHQIIGILSNKIIGVRYLQLNELQSNVSTFTQNNYLMRGITNDHTVLLDGLNFFTNEKFIVNEMV